MPRHKFEGLDVVDAIKPRIITVTSSDIKNARNDDPGKCVAARAICRGSSATEARVFVARTLIRENGKWIRYQTPAALRTELVSWDRAKIFFPGQFRLVPLPKSQRLGTSTAKAKAKRTGRQKRAKSGMVLGVRNYYYHEEGKSQGV